MIGRQPRGQITPLGVLMAGLRQQRLNQHVPTDLSVRDGRCVGRDGFLGGASGCSGMGRRRGILCRDGQIGGGLGLRAAGVGLGGILAAAAGGQCQRDGQGQRMQGCAFFDVHESLRVMVSVKDPDVFFLFCGQYGERSAGCRPI